jgi:hypothetical protein
MSLLCILGSLENKLSETHPCKIEIPYSQK